MSESLSWKTIGSERVHENPWFSVRKDSVVQPDGKPGEYYVVERAGAVVIVAEDETGKLVLVRQTKYPVGKRLLEFPAGLVEGGENPIEAAKRELKEETGLSAESWESLGSLYPSAGMTDEKEYVFLARGLSEGTSELEGTEDIEVVRMPLGDIRNHVLSGEEQSGFFLAAFLLYEERKRREVVSVSE
jgi:8-oxo-dGTP pyrophosphatase MutT (NUDIX family)